MNPSLTIQALATRTARRLLDHPGAARSVAAAPSDNYLHLATGAIALYFGTVGARSRA